MVGIDAPGPRTGAAPLNRMPIAAAATNTAVAIRLAIVGSFFLFLRALFLRQRLTARTLAKRLDRSTTFD